MRRDTRTDRSQPGIPTSSRTDETHSSSHFHGSHAGAVATDPVCGMTVDTSAGGPSTLHDGATYHFCSGQCETRFLADPGAFNASTHPDEHAHSHRHSRDTKPAPGSTDVEYTCPMHPEIRQMGPGSCPICGMAMEPVMASAEVGQSAELVEMTRRFWVAVALSIPVLVLSMGAELVDAIDDAVPDRLSTWLQLLLATPVVLWAGWPFFTRAWTSVRTLKLNMFTLIAIGTGVAWLFSVVATVSPGLFPDAFRTMDGTVAVYFEAASVITTLVLLGQVLELRAREQTSGAIRALLDLTPKTAHRVEHNGEGAESEADVELTDVRLDDLLRVRPGEQVPVDAEVVEGRTTVDESMITGESMPVGKAAGDTVIGGTLNQSGTLLVRASAVGRDTMLARIVQMVADAQRSRAPIQRLADQVSSWFVPAVVGIALVAFAVWSVIGPDPRLAHALVIAVSVLIIACPCALGLATPMSIMVGVGRGARMGVLIRNAEALERMERVDTVVVDKTGTLTEGKPSITAVVSTGGLSKMDLLRLAAAVENASEHPLARAVVDEARDRQAETGVLPAVEDFDARAGKGVTGVVDGRRVAIGTASFLQSHGADPRTLADVAHGLRQSGATAVLVAIDGQPGGVIGIADRVKDSTPQALATLRSKGVDVIMLTGDNQVTAQAVAGQLGIDHVEAEVLPDHKSEVVTRLRREGRVVAFAGDGVNDAPALAAADVGLAMSTGTDVAIESAGVTLLRGDLNGIAHAGRLSRATMRNIRGNLWLAFAYNVAGIPIAAGVLYPAYGLLLSPMIAAAAMSLSSVSVIGHALRLRSVRL